MQGNLQDAGPIGKWVKPPDFVHYTHTKEGELLFSSSPFLKLLLDQQAKWIASLRKAVSMFAKRMLYRSGGVYEQDYLADPLNGEWMRNSLE